MTSVFVLKIYNNPDCNFSTIAGVYKNQKDAIAERDRLRAGLPERAFSFEWGIYCPRYLIDIVEYDLL